MKVNPYQSSTRQAQVETSKTSKSSDAEKANDKKADNNAATPGAIPQVAVEAEISTKAKEFVKAKEVATNAPEIREAKIAELKRRIAEGKYKVDADKVADKMVEDHLKSAEKG